MAINPGEFAIHNDTGDDMPAGALAEWAGGFTSRGALKVVKVNVDHSPAAAQRFRGPEHPHVGAHEGRPDRRTHRRCTA